MPMVAGSPVLRNLEQVTSKLIQIAKKTTNINEIPEEEVVVLTKVLSKCNVSFDDLKILEDKKFVQEEMAQSIKEALLAVAFFNLEGNKTGKKSVEQVLVSLYASFMKELNDFSSKLKKLDKNRLGDKVEKIDTGKNLDYSGR